MTLDLFTSGSAVLSECGRYRYRLDRTVDLSKRGRVCWVMLNPSCAGRSGGSGEERRAFSKPPHHDTSIARMCCRAISPLGAVSRDRSRPARNARISWIFLGLRRSTARRACSSRLLSFMVGTRIGGGSNLRVVIPCSYSCGASCVRSRSHRLSPMERASRLTDRSRRLVRQADPQTPHGPTASHRASLVRSRGR